MKKNDTMWVARDKDGSLALFLDKPRRGRDQWGSDLTDGERFLSIDPKLFPDQRWDDDPVPVDLFRTDVFPMTKSYESKILETSKALRNDGGFDEESFRDGMQFFSNFMCVANRIKWRDGEPEGDNPETAAGEARRGSIAPISEEDLGTLRYEYTNSHEPGKGLEQINGCVFRDRIEQDKLPNPIIWYVELAGLFSSGFDSGFREAEKTYGIKRENKVKSYCKKL